MKDLIIENDQSKTTPLVSRLIPDGKLPFDPLRDPMISIFDAMRESEKTDQRFIDVIENVVSQGEALGKDQKERIMHRYIESSTVKSAMKHDVWNTALIVLGAVALGGLAVYVLSNSNEEST